MYYKKYPDIPSIPEELKKEIISFAEKKARKDRTEAFYYDFEKKDESSVAFLDGQNNFENDDRQSGGVGFYRLPADLNKKIVSFYKNPKISFPTNKPWNYFVQVVTGGPCVFPHIDAADSRTNGLIYLLKSGGPNVRTRWYEPKKEYAHLKLTQCKGIPYSRLDVVEDRCLEEDTWHHMNFLAIHSVEYQESLRLALWGY
jgi:hypothetical protein